jgi:hypothetical protein
MKTSLSLVRSDYLHWTSRSFDVLGGALKIASFDLWGTY